MAHIAKYTKAQCGHLIRHNLRAKDDLGQYITFGQSFVHPERTHLNYQLGPEDPRARLEQRLSEVKVQKRKDVKVFCSWVVTLPRDGSVQPDEQRAFFESTYKHLCAKYGEKNVVCASVHMDETTPHMHFGFIPVVPDKKHPGREKVSAKELITPQHLKTFHSELKNALENDLGHPVGVTLSESQKIDFERFRGSYVPLVQLKKETAKAREELLATRPSPENWIPLPQPTSLIDKAKDVLEAPESRANRALEANQPILEKAKKVKPLVAEVNRLKQENLELGKENDSLKTKLKDAQSAVSALSKQSTEQKRQIRTLTRRVEHQEKQLQTQSKLIEFYRKAEERFPALKEFREEVQRQAERLLFWRHLERIQKVRKQRQQQALREQLDAFADRFDQFYDLTGDKDLSVDMANSVRPEHLLNELQKRTAQADKQGERHVGIRRHTM